MTLVNRDRDAGPLDAFTDVRDLQRQLKAAAVEMLSEADETTTGPASFMVVDPDGNPILVDQHRVGAAVRCCATALAYGRSPTRRDAGQAPAGRSAWAVAAAREASCFKPVAVASARSR